MGIDRGVVVSAALSTGDLLHAPGLTAREQTRLRRLQRTLARAKRGSNRRGRVKRAIARLRARETDRRKDWAEKTSTDLAQRFDVIRVEDLKIDEHDPVGEGTRESPGRNVRQKAGLNRGILGSGWGCRCAGWRRRPRAGWRRSSRITRASGARRAGRWTGTRARVKPSSGCTACGFACHADANAARNIAAGHAVTARGGDGVTRPANREPHLLLPSAW